MKKFIIVLVSSLMLASVGNAATKQEKAEELLSLMNTESTLDAVYNQIMIPITCRMKISSAEEVELKKEIIKIADLDSFVKELSQFWVQNLTESELDQLIAFCKTDLGKKTIELLPQYSQFSSMKFQKWRESKGQAFTDLGTRLAHKYPAYSGEETEKCMQAKMGM